MVDMDVEMKEVTVEPCERASVSTSWTARSLPPPHTILTNALIHPGFRLFQDLG